MFSVYKALEKSILKLPTDMIIYLQYGWLKLNSRF